MPDASGESITSSLLDLVRANDNHGWRRLEQLYRPVIERWCRRGGVPARDVEDVAQEVLKGIMRTIDRFERQSPRMSFRGWLYGVARNKVSDYWRRQARQPLLADNSDVRRRLDELPAEYESLGAESGVGQAEQFDQADVVRRALELIRVEYRPNTWQAFHRVTIDEAPAAAVAEELGMSVGAVYVAKSRVLARLRDELSGLEEIAHG